MLEYDVIIIGAGHAGCEAALASAKMGCRTLAFTVHLDTVGNMPCNPAIGGSAKGQMVGEIDALGGHMGIAADKTFIQMKVLNRSRGPAVQCLRAQSDKREYSLEMKHAMESQSNIDIRQAMVTSLFVEDNQVLGVYTELGRLYRAKSVLITSGTFLSGKIHIGMHNFPAGRMGEQSAIGLSDNLKKHGLKLGRLKTGTTPRLDARSLNYKKMEMQPGDPEPLKFSFRHPHSFKYQTQQPCYLTYTNENTHKIILDNLDRSPIYQGEIEGAGPRYCPSIEDKIKRFSDKPSHQLFMEPEGLNTNEVYAQGLNTSMPEDVQEAFLKTIPGLEDARVLKPGYAVEYDFLFPNQLYPSLECRSIKNLFFAGQICGTSGYEEAAGQGILAGINAALRVVGKSPFILKREESYIGTMIDDLVHKNVINEPYRMLSSRSEYRLCLRQDNAHFRLGKYGYDFGLLTKDEYSMITDERALIDDAIKISRKTSVTDLDIINHNLKQKITVFQLLKRTGVDILSLDFDFLKVLPSDTLKRMSVEVKYDGYLVKQEKEIEKQLRYAQKEIPSTLNFDNLHGLRQESRDKLKRYSPKTIFEAQKIAGVNPADIGILLAYIS